MKDDKEPVLFYIHVPKTAGTTMKLIIIWLYKWDEIFWAKSTDYIKKKLKALDNEHLNNIKIVAGHTPFGMHRHFEFSDYRYFTILRDPVERAISQFFYMQQKPKHPYYPIATNPDYTYEELLENKLINNTFNVQTYWLIGENPDFFKKGVYDEEVVKQAKANIDKHFAFIGLNDRFDESLILMKRKFNWTLPFYTPKNINKKKKKDKVSARTLELIQHYNQMDIELFNYCKAKFESELAENKDEAFEHDLAHLHKLNRRYGRYKPYRAKIVSSLIQKELKTLFSKKETPDILP